MSFCDTVTKSSAWLRLLSAFMSVELVALNVRPSSSSFITSSLELTYTGQDDKSCAAGRGQAEISN